MRSDNDDDYSRDSEDPTLRSDAKPGPPDDWPHPSWFGPQERDWWWKGKPDPCPVKPLGFVDGAYLFVTRLCEVRAFTSGQLHSRGGLTDLFGGSMSWPLRHFSKLDPETKEPTGALQGERCIRALIRACGLAGFQSGDLKKRSVGTWRGPDGDPIVHCGDRIFHGQTIDRPGVRIGSTLYVIDGVRLPPAHTTKDHRTFDWTPCGPEIGRAVTAALDEWNWEDGEGRDLFQGGLFCDLLGEAPAWRPHKFLRAPFAAGKSSLLKYCRALLGSAAHPIQSDYSKAFIEQNFKGTAAAFLLDEAESDNDQGRVGHLFELIRLLSDGDGAVGGRGTSGGKARSLDVHGTVTMVATVSDTWRPQDRSRIVLLELRPLADRRDRSPATPKLLQSLVEAASEVSPGLRARAIAKWPLFNKNVAIARKAVMDMGGIGRDGDQLGHLIAGWWTMISDEPLNEDDVEQLKRFRPYIMSVTESEEGEDDASDCFNTLMGLTPQTKWTNLGQLTVGQIVARARDGDGSDYRSVLPGLGLRLERKNEETWAQAWLCIANKHASLDRLFVDYPQWRGGRRKQVMADLRRPQLNGEVLQAMKSAGHLWFGGVQSRYLQIPPGFLPSRHNETQ